MEMSEQDTAIDLSDRLQFDPKTVLNVPQRSESRLRWALRSNKLAQTVLYLSQSLWWSNFGRLQRFSRAIRVLGTKGSGVAICGRIRDEARYLREWIEYYVVAGVEHFFLYECRSTDNYLDVLRPYIERELVTLFCDWPHIPMSPAVEEHCLLNAMGRYEWLGFVDIDEFVVVGDNLSIGEFLREFRDSPAVALHWRMFGSGGRKTCENIPIVASHTVRAKNPSCHVKCFVRPECVTQHRNSHSSYYAGMRTAVSELGQHVFGSLSFPATAERAWINHYHCKSEEDYIRKIRHGNVVDRTGMAAPGRTMERMVIAMRANNEEFDDCALRYYHERCRQLGTKALF